MGLQTGFNAISPLDGRYADILSDLRQFLSEGALFRYRVYVEIKWFCLLTNELPELKSIDESSKQFLLERIDKFSEADVAQIKQIENITRHDVKAVEYFVKQIFAEYQPLSSYAEFVHFECTSEDINNIAYALLLRDIRSQKLLPELERLIETLRANAHAYAEIPMLARTHGQPASPTTLGKEFANVVERLRRQYVSLTTTPICAKINGAVGNYNAHHFAYPLLDWAAITNKFITFLGLTWSEYTTQIEPNDYIAEISHILFRINTIFIDFCRDIWGYISLGYFNQKLVTGEVGSSTMPHKINPIDFENAEGNLGLANSLWQFFAEKLPISRWQRDLSDSTVKRNIGVALAHSLLAYRSITQGLARLQPNLAALSHDLDLHPEVLTEAIQTVLRSHGIQNSYEKMKEFSRGKVVTQENLNKLIDALDLPAKEKERLKQLKPTTYLGLAIKLAKAI